MNTTMNTSWVRASMISLILIPGFSMVTYDKVHAQKTINVGYGYDISYSSNESKSFGEKATLIDIVKLLNLQDSKDGVNLYTGTIGSDHTPEFRLASLPEMSKYFGSLDERNSNLGKFYKKALSNLQVLNQPCTASQTQIFRSLKTLQNHLAEGADRTILILQSDMVEASPIINFHDYKSDPSRLVGDAFNEVLSAFEADGNLELTGYEIIILNPGNTEVALWSGRFFKRAMEQHWGAKSVTIKAAL